MKIQVLVVDDYEPWRRHVSTALQTQPDLQIIAEAADGLQAVKDAEQLKPDLILLDIVLPGLNGIEAARRIRKLFANSKILFVSMERNPDVAWGALGTGAHCYLVKSDAESELFVAIRTVMGDERFVSSSVDLAKSRVKLRRLHRALLGTTSRFRCCRRARSVREK